MLAEIDSYAPINSNDRTLVRIAPNYIKDEIFYEDLWLPTVQVYQRPVINGVEFVNSSKDRETIVQLLTLIPRGNGILGTSLERVIYGEVGLEGDRLLHKDLQLLQQPLDNLGFRVFNPFDTGPVRGARYSLLKNGEQIILEDFDKVDQQKELVMRASQKDEWAFTKLYEIHRDQIYRFLMYRFEDSVLAQNVAGEVFLKAWEKIEGFEWREVPFSHWLIRMARNMVVDYYRANKTKLVDIYSLFDATDQAPSVEDQADNNITIDTLKQSLEELPGEYREVVILRFIDGYSHEDVASALGKNVVAIRQMQHRAVTKLRKIMTQKGYRPDF